MSSPPPPSPDSFSADTPNGKSATGQAGHSPDAHRRRLVVAIAAATLAVGVAAALLVPSDDGIVVDDPDPDVTAAADDATDADPVECGEDTRQPDEGGGHIAPEAIADERPADIYDTPPPTSGRHLPMVVASGAYDVAVDPRLTTHNLEHGYVVMWLANNAPNDVSHDLRAAAQALIESGTDKIVVARYPDSLPGGEQVALTAWFHSQLCSGVDTAAITDFIEAHYSQNGDAPEKNVATHMAGAQGVLSPEEGQDLLFPPLDEPR